MLRGVRSSYSDRLLGTGTADKISGRGVGASLTPGGLGKAALFGAVTGGLSGCAVLAKGLGTVMASETVKVAQPVIVGVAAAEGQYALDVSRGRAELTLGGVVTNGIMGIAGGLTDSKFSELGYSGYANAAATGLEGVVADLATDPLQEAIDSTISWAKATYEGAVYSLYSEVEDYNRSCQAATEDQD